MFIQMNQLAPSSDCLYKNDNAGLRCFATEKREPTFDLHSQMKASASERDKQIKAIHTYLIKRERLVYAMGRKYNVLHMYSRER